MLPFMAKALLIWGEPAPRREVSFDWPVAESNGGSYWRTAGRLICIRSDRARVTPRLKHAGKDLKGTAPRAARTGRRGGGNGDGYRRYRPEEPGLRYPSFQPSLLPAPGKPSPRLPATLVGASREDAPRTRNTPPPPPKPQKTLLLLGDATRDLSTHAAHPAGMDQGAARFSPGTPSGVGWDSHGWLGIYRTGQDKTQIRIAPAPADRRWDEKGVSVYQDMDHNCLRVRRERSPVPRSPVGTAVPGGENRAGPTTRTGTRVVVPSCSHVLRSGVNVNKNRV